MSIKILTYNVHGLPWCSTDMDSIAKWLFSDVQANIICLQEVFSMKQRTLLQEEALKHGWMSFFPNDRCILGSVKRGLECGSGLAIFVDASVKVLSVPQFTPFSVKGGVDALVKKGFYQIQCSMGDTDFFIINTHQQSDLTDVPCIRIYYNETRGAQQLQLYNAVRGLSRALVIGDMNMATFKWFERLNPVHHITFPETGEHLDHALILRKDCETIKHRQTIYYDHIQWSDHIPVLYVLRLVDVSKA